MAKLDDPLGIADYISEMRGLTKISHRQLMLILLAAFALLTCASCINDSPHRAISENRAATPEELTEWRAKHGFSTANETEISQAKRMETRFKNHRAVSPSGKLQVVFQRGQLVGSLLHGASTTSVYQLKDRSGRILLTAPSRVIEREHTGGSQRTQLAWFSKDGSKVLLYEDINFCNGPDPFVILFYQDLDVQGQWKAKFLGLGGTLNAPFSEGDYAECRGMLGDEILIRNTGEGISKIHFNRLEEKYPFPWIEG